MELVWILGGGGLWKGRLRRVIERWWPSWITSPRIPRFGIRQFITLLRGAWREGEAASRATYHTAFTFLIGVLLILAEQKFNGGTSLFTVHPKLATSFILTICIYAISYVKMLRLDPAETRNYSMVEYIAIFSGFASCELILAALVPVIAFVAIDTCALLFFILLSKEPLKWCHEMFKLVYEECGHVRGRISWWFANHFRSTIQDDVEAAFSNNNV
ncbi:hypothetical protein CDL15_Pgr028978 [Punica granatum]|uniref:Uncharacterized protein n=1 Tax=Punica granatum TaxID=22663 RepID=A0A218XK23_PUNGR|nr:hypothetical protein CDL15_Pgr028978 [Punica granatum]PKI57412.1 hypothetical protein CRG98_022257 [Punica granatum]